MIVTTLPPEKYSILEQDNKRSLGPTIRMQDSCLPLAASLRQWHWYLLIYPQGRRGLTSFAADYAGFSRVLHFGEEQQSSLEQVEEHGAEK